MNKILIVEASNSDCRLMSGLLTRAGYESIVAVEMEAAKQEVTKLAVRKSYPAHKILFCQVCRLTSELLLQLLSCKICATKTLRSSNLTKKKFL